MKDVTGKELEIGQIVVTMFDEYSHLTVCEIVKITPKKIGVILKDEKTAAPITKLRMRENSHLKIRYKFPDQVAVVLA